MRKLLIFLTPMVALFWLYAPFLQAKEKGTLSISLVQQASVKKLKDKEVIFERYKVKKGDYIWKLLRQRGLLKRPDAGKLIALLKGMNKSLTNLDLIHPGQTILIPLNIIPIRGHREKEGFFKESIMGISSLEEIPYDNYVVKPGDNLTMIVRSRYKIPSKDLYNEYLNLVQKFNPTLKNVDLIYPRQIIRLPIYSPEIVRVPIEQPEKKIAFKKTPVTPPEEKSRSRSLREKLGEIFNQMEEEWIDTGEQFIPLKSGGQVNLRADNFPVLNLRSGIRLIIDINNELPEDISRLIEADWEEYRIIHLDPGDNLKTAMDKILADCHYYKILRPGEQFTVGGTIKISLAGDWVVIPYKSTGPTTEKIVVISSIRNTSERTPETVKVYLEKLGIRVIDYSDFPISKDITEIIPVRREVTIEKNIPFPLPSLLLNLAGQPFSRQVKIPVYQKAGTGFSLIIQADLFFNRQGKDCIIDTTGLSLAVQSLLKKHQFLVLSLADVKDPIRTIERILTFLGVQYEPQPHTLLAAARDETRNITLTIPGISFYDQAGKKILATTKKMPEEIVSFLNLKGFNLLDLNHLEGQ